MPRPKENLEKVTIRLTDGACAELAEFYPHLGHNKAIRIIVDKHIKTLREKLNQKRSNTDGDIELGDITSIADFTAN